MFKHIADLERLYGSTWDDPYLSPVTECLTEDSPVPTDLLGDRIASDSQESGAFSCDRQFCEHCEAGFGCGDLRAEYIRRCDRTIDWLEAEEAFERFELYRSILQARRLSESLP